MVETRLQEKSRMAEERFQALEQRMQTFDTTLQGLLTGFNAGIASLRQEIKKLRVADQNSSRNQDRLQLWHLHQQRSVADFNSVFDSFSANLNVPEDYLVDAYVYGLKKEIADSVGLFQPRTMHEAKILARMQEIIIEMQTEKARRVLKDQESDGSCLFNTQECFINQEASIKHEPEEPEPSDVQEINEYDHEVSIVHDDDASSKPISDVSGSVSASLASVLPISLSNVSVLSPQVSLSTNGRLGVNGFLSFDSVDAWRATSVATGKREASKFRVEVGEPKKLDFRGRFQEESHKKSSCSTLLSLFQSFGLRSLQSIDYALALGNTQQSMWQVQTVMWLQDGEFEKSNLQLSPKSSKCQSYSTKVLGLTGETKEQFGKSDIPLQLACILSYWQKYFKVDAYYGFVSQEKAWIQWLINKALFCNLLPTLCMSLTWFKGCLIKMLIGSSLIQGVIYLAEANNQWIIGWTSVSCRKSSKYLYCTWWDPQAQKTKAHNCSLILYV